MMNLYSSLDEQHFFRKIELEYFLGKIENITPQKL